MPINDPPEYKPGQATPGTYNQPYPAPQQYSTPQQYPPTQPYVSDAPQYQGPPPKRKSFLGRNAFFYPLIATIAIAILVVSGYIVLYKTNWIPDSGIQACEAMAKQVSDQKEPSGDSDKITQQEYDKLRDAFADSRYDDISQPGVRLVDAIWNLQNTPEDQQIGAAFATMGSMMGDLSSLQSGCKNHGIQVNLMQN